MIHSACKSFIRFSSVALAILLLAAPFAFASGGGSGGGGGGGSIHEEMLYERGKKLFGRHVVCDTCPYSDLSLEAGAVATIWPDLQSDLQRDGVIGKNLKRYQRTSLKKYIKQRYKVR